MTGYLGGDPPDAQDVGLPVLAREGQARAEVTAHDVAVQAGDRALAVLEDQVVQCPGQRRLAAAGQAREEDHQPPLLGTWLVLPHQVRDPAGQAVGVVGRGLHPGAAPGCVGVHDLLAQPRVEVDVAVVGQRAGHDVGLEAVARQDLGGDQALAHQAHRRGPAGCAVADQRQDQHLLAVGGQPDLLEVALGRWAGDRHDQPVAVRPDRLGRGEVQPPERAVRRRRQRGEPAAGVEPWPGGVPRGRRARPRERRAAPAGARG